jgi:hypothetical protein
MLNAAKHLAWHSHGFEQRQISFGSAQDRLSTSLGMTVGWVAAGFEPVD